MRCIWVNPIMSHILTKGHHTYVIRGSDLTSRMTWGPTQESFSKLVYNLYRADIFTEENAMWHEGPVV